MALIALGVERHHLALAEGVVERGVDGRDRHAQGARAVAVDHHARFEAADGAVGIDVLEDRDLAHALGEAQREVLQLIDVLAQQRVLIAGAGGAAAGAEILHRLHGELDAGDLVGRGADALHDLRHALAALLEGLENDGHAALVRCDRAADEGDHAGDGRVVHHRLVDLALLLGHAGEGDIRRGVGRAPHQAGVLLREQALGT